MVETHVVFPRSYIPTFIWRRRVKPRTLHREKSHIDVTSELDDFLYTEKENVGSMSLYPRYHAATALA
jgi:hypothetical protein